MGKLFGAFMRFLVLLGLLGLVGYNTWETVQLRREVEALRQQAGGVTVKEKSGTAAKADAEGRSDPASLLASARRHYDAAQEHLARKEFADASREMMLASQAAKKASQNAGALSGSKLREFQQAVQSLSKRATELIDQDETGGERKPENDPSK
ncbi:MAG: hypothetical protein V4671_09730 [Armatimonadota bacterium]